MTTKANATITRTFIGYNVTAQVAQVIDGNATIASVTKYVAGNTLTDSAIRKTFAPDTVLVVKDSKRIEKLYGISEEDFLTYGVELPARPEYPSVRARKEARQSK